MTGTKPLKIKLEPWPNRLGVNAIVNRTGFEIWNEGRFTRVVKDGSLCGFRGTHYLDYRGRATFDSLTDEAKAELAYALWIEDRDLWQECI